MKIKNYTNGHASMEKLMPSGMYLVKVYCDTELRDKIRCDTYRMACDYFRAFCAIAKNN